MDARHIYVESRSSRAFDIISECCRLRARPRQTLASTQPASRLSHKMKMEPTRVPIFEDGFVTTSEGVLRVDKVVSIRCKLHLKAGFLGQDKKIDSFNPAVVRAYMPLTNIPNDIGVMHAYLIISGLFEGHIFQITHEFTSHSTSKGNTLSVIDDWHVTYKKLVKLAFKDPVISPQWNVVQ